MDTLKNKKFSEIDKIDDSTKVRVWVEIINRIVDENSTREYIFNAMSINGIAIYDFGSAIGLPSNFPNFQFYEDDNYIVTYGGVVLQADDYKLTGQKLIFMNGAPLENDYLITIRYVGKKNDIRI